jgi:hypothetical protein
VTCADEGSEEKYERKLVSRAAPRTEVRDHARTVDRNLNRYQRAEVQNATRAANPEVIKNDEDNRNPGYEGKDNLARRRVIFRNPKIDRPAMIKGMSEREIYDVSRVFTDPFDPVRTDRELVDRAHHAVDLAYFPVAGNDQARCQEHIDRLLLRNDVNFRPSELAQRILATGSRGYQELFTKLVVSGLRGVQLPLSREDEKILQPAMTVGTGSQGGFAVVFQLDPTLVPTSNGSVNPYRAVCPRRADRRYL